MEILNRVSGHIIYSADEHQCIGGMTYYQLTIRGSGAKTLCGDINVTNSFLIFEDAPDLSLDVTASNYTITLNCNWRNTGEFIPQDGVVIMDGNNLEIDRDNIGDETFNKLDVRTSAGLILRDNVYVTDSLLMSGSNIITNADTLTIGTGAGVQGAIDRNSGSVVGNLRRWIDNTADTYVFPVGTSTSYNPLFADFNNLATQGYVVGTFNAADPGDAGLAAIYEDSLYMVNVFDEGYWRLVNQSASSNDYNVSVEANGFTSADVIGAGTRLVTRPNSGADWTLIGNHVDAAGDTISRNNITQFGAQFGVCDTTSCMPNTDTIVGNDTVCEFSTGVTYSVTNSAGSVYKWIISGGTQASGSNTNSITVDWGATMDGSVKVVEDNGCAVGDTVSLDVHVRAYPDDPGPITDIDTIIEGAFEIFSIVDVPNAETYTWTLPAGLTGSSDSTSIQITADVGSGGSDYTIQVVGTNACGNSSNPSSETFYVDFGLPAKPTIPVGPITVCQDDIDTIFRTTSTLRADSYEWDLIGAGAGTISGSDTAGTVNWDAAFSGAAGVAVRAVNGNGNGPWSDTLSVTVITKPALNFTALPAFDTICDGNNTTLEVDFTSGTAPYSFTVSDGTNTENLNNISADPYQFSPATAPVWTAGKMTQYSYVITTITDDNGCEATSITGPDVEVLKIPETGNTYFIENPFNKN